jgi:hypothetical protein
MSIFKDVSGSLELLTIYFAFACFLSIVANSRITILIAFYLLV